jgi:hypothetical protein
MPTPKRTRKSPAGSPAKKSAKKAVKKTVKKVVKKAAKKTAKKAAAKTAKKAAPKKAAKKIAKKAAGKKTVAKPVLKKTPVTVSAPKSPAKKAAPPARRPKAFAPQSVERGFGFPANAPEIPELYGEDRLVLMTKDPEYLFAYWEITPEKIAAGEAGKRRGEDYREAMRLNWAARDLFERNFAVLPVSLDARKWYLRVPFSGLSYQIELGWLGSQGHFIALLTSNPSDAPESWNATRRRLKAAGAAGGVLARTLGAGRPQGSSDLAGAASSASSVPPIDWNFGGPGSLASSFGKKAKGKPGAGKAAAKNAGA